MIDFFSALLLSVFTLAGVELYVKGREPWPAIERGRPKYLVLTVVLFACASVQWVRIFQ